MKTSRVSSYIITILIGLGLIYCGPGNNSKGVKVGDKINISTDNEYFKNHNLQNSIVTVESIEEIKSSDKNNSNKENTYKVKFKEIKDHIIFPESALENFSIENTDPKENKDTKANKDNDIEEEKYPFLDDIEPDSKSPEEIIKELGVQPGDRILRYSANKEFLKKKKITDWACTIESIEYRKHQNDNMSETCVCYNLPDTIYLKIKEKKEKIHLFIDEFRKLKILPKEDTSHLYEISEYDKVLKNLIDNLDYIDHEDDIDPKIVKYIENITPKILDLKNKLDEEKKDKKNIIIKNEIGPVCKLLFNNDFRPENIHKTIISMQPYLEEYFPKVVNKILETCTDPNNRYKLITSMMENYTDDPLFICLEEMLYYKSEIVVLKYVFENNIIALSEIKISNIKKLINKTGNTCNKFIIIFSAKGLNFYHYKIANELLLDITKKYTTNDLSRIEHIKKDVIEDIITYDFLPVVRNDCNTYKYKKPILDKMIIENIYSYHDLIVKNLSNRGYTVKLINSSGKEGYVPMNRFYIHKEKVDPYKKNILYLMTKDAEMPGYCVEYNTSLSNQSFLHSCSEANVTVIYYDSYKKFINLPQRLKRTYDWIIINGHGESSNILLTKKNSKACVFTCASPNDNEYFPYKFKYFSNFGKYIKMLARADSDTHIILPNCLNGKINKKLGYNISQVLSLCLPTDTSTVYAAPYTLKAVNLGCFYENNIDPKDQIKFVPSDMFVTTKGENKHLLKKFKI